MQQSSLFSKLWQLCLKYKEILLYLVFGGLTTLVSIGSYALMDTVLGIDPLIANVISWILAVLFAYFTNRKWVFSDTAETKNGIIIEMASFFGGRLFSLAVEEAILLVFIKWLGFNSIIVKVAAQVVVVVLNYVISKVLVFRTKKNQTASEKK